MPRKLKRTMMMMILRTKQEPRVIRSSQTRRQLI